MSNLHSKLLAGVPGIEHAFLDPRREPPADFVRLHQVHSETVVKLVDEPADEMGARKADGLITDTTRPVGVQTGDCLPVLYASRDARVVAAVHAGWRGLHKGILVNAVREFERRGVEAQDLVIAIGPAIHRCCFEVSRDVVDHFEKDWSHLWQGREAPWQEGQPKSEKLGRAQAPISSNNLWIDLDLIARYQLTSVGVLDTNIEDVGYCTYCGPGERASYRRGTHEAAPAGRQWSWIRKT